MAGQLQNAMEVLRTDPRYGYLGLATWFAMLVATVVSGVYVVFYMLFILGYLLVMTQMEDLVVRSKVFQRFVMRPAWQHFLIITLVALAMRWVMLLQDQVITGDLETTVKRSTYLMEGKLPYIDFGGGTKPPAYEYMLYFVGVSVGPDAMQMRAMFSLADAVVAGVIYLASRTRYGTGHSLAMAMIYAMCPVAIVTVGISARYDGVVNLFLIASLWTLLKGRYDTSAILLGIGFSLKIYPAAVLPFMAVGATMLGGYWSQGLKMRLLGMIRYGALFILPFLGSLVPLALIEPMAVDAYFEERGVFTGWGSFTTWVRRVLETDHVGDYHVAYVFLALFGTLMLLLFFDWLRNGSHALRRWTRWVILLIAVHYGFYFSLFFQYYDIENWQLLTFVFVAAWLVLVAFLYRRYIHELDLGSDEELSVEGSGIPVVGALALVLFVLFMPTIGTWYYLWPLTFVLLIGVRDVRDTLLWMLFWHAVGGGVSLLPGMPPVN